MSSGFSGGAPEYFNYAGERPTNMFPNFNNNDHNNYPHLPYRSTVAAAAGILPERQPNPQILHRGLPGGLIGKRSLAEFQRLQLLQLQRQQQQQGVYLRNVKPRIYQQASPISPLSAVDFSPDQLSSAACGGARYGVALPQQLRQLPLDRSASTTSSSVSLPNLMQDRAAPAAMDDVSAETEKKNMMNKLQELEKTLFDDSDEDEQGQDVSVVTNSEWSETIQSLLSPTHKPISPSPTSPSSSCSSTSTSVNIACPKQSLIDVALAISEGKPEIASEILTRLTHVSNVKGTSEQRLTAYMAAALRSRVNSTQYPPPVTQLFSKEHAVSTQMLYEVSPCFKLSFMAANLAIIEATSSSSLNHAINKLHVIDFDIGQGGQYVHLLHALAAKKDNKPGVLKITTFKDFANGGEERLRVVGDELKAVAKEVGLSLVFNVMDITFRDLSPEKLGLEENGEALAVNFAFRLYKLPDESVTTENLRDELLRRVRRLSPKVVTVVEKEMNTNTAPFVARVKEVYGYYGALFDSLDSTAPRENLDRVRVEEGLGRKMANSVACEGRDRVERCEVFGKWRARMSMAGFGPKPINQLVADSLLSKLNSGNRCNPGFTINAQNGGIGFGWMGRTLAVVSTWH